MHPENVSFNIRIGRTSHIRNPTPVLLFLQSCNCIILSDSTVRPLWLSEQSVFVNGDYEDWLDFIVLFPACLCESLLALLIVLGDAASKEMVQGYSGPTPKQQGPSQIRAHADRSQPGAQVPGVNQLLDAEQTTADHFACLFSNLHAINHYSARPTT